MTPEESSLHHSPLPAHPRREVAAVFLRLGCIAFGGPAAHVAMMRREVVERRDWISEQEFLDLFGAANLIPGPSSTELAILLGYRRAGRTALLLAGALFILPAMLLVLAFAWAYVRFGNTPAAGRLLYGIKPVIIAIVAAALWSLGRTAIKGPLFAALALAALALFLIGVNPLPLLLGGGAVALVAGRPRLHWRWLRRAARSFVPMLPLSPAPALAAGAINVTGYNPLTLFLTFLKIGAVLYGSGYVLLAFLRDDFVTRLHWLTNQQLIDAVAVG
ncbi:MAG TPA: chromate efflux transporter, partial [Dehalococcoidia bacterium]